MMEFCYQFWLCGNKVKVMYRRHISGSLQSYVKCWNSTLFGKEIKESFLLFFFCMLRNGIGFLPFYSSYNYAIVSLILDEITHSRMITFQ